MVWVGCVLIVGQNLSRGSHKIQVKKMTDITSQKVLEVLDADGGTVEVEALVEAFVPKKFCDECGCLTNEREWYMTRGEVKDHLSSLEQDGYVEQVSPMTYQAVRQE